MWKPNKACNVCRLILGGDSELKKRIYNSTRFTPDGGGDSLQDIYRAYGGTKQAQGVFSYQSLMKHCQNHQVLDQAKRMAADKTAVQQATASVPTIMPSIQPEEVYQEAMAQGMEKLKAGELQITARDLLKAATDKATIDLKKKDQEFKLAEMVYHFASGEASNATDYDRRIIAGETATAYDAADITARNIDPGA